MKQKKHLSAMHGFDRFNVNSFFYISINHQHLNEVVTAAM